MQENKQSAISQIDQLLQQQAQYYSNYTKEHLNYWTWLNERLNYDTLKDTDFVDYYTYDENNEIANAMSTEQ